VLVKASEQGVVVEDVPEAVLDLFEADVFAVEAWLRKCCPECRRKVPAPLTRGVRRT
jgi:hypothetical protein